jgi:endonuclease/exonuclease/phosphatase family metal-dependent hydrolase|tara:strand:- start:23339 stop:24367 length:1029 start_codon:yes stop_codon:yes gene_type:complete
MKSFNNTIFITLFLIGCSSGGGSNPTDSQDGNSNNSMLFDIANATNYNYDDQIEVVTWNVKLFPTPDDGENSSDYVKALLEKWNADVYLLQEINSESSLISMVNSMTDYSYIVDDESGNLGFALVYKDDFITFNSKNELWSDTSNSDDGDSDYNNNAAYQFADRPPMENYLTWSDGTDSFNFYLIGIHYKCCGDGAYNANNTKDETTRRHHASLLLSNHIISNRSSDNVILLGDFNNVGAQSITNPTLSPFTDQNNFNSASSFKLTDLQILEGPSNGYSWQGWTSSYSAAHLDHIIINQPMFAYDSGSMVQVISTTNETGLSGTNVSNLISDHQPVIYRFSP